MLNVVILKLLCHSTIKVFRSEQPTFLSRIIHCYNNLINTAVQQPNGVSDIAWNKILTACYIEGWKKVFWLSECWMYIGKLNNQLVKSLQHSDSLNFSEFRSMAWLNHSTAVKTQNIQYLLSKKLQMKLLQLLCLWWHRARSVKETFFSVLV